MNASLAAEGKGIKKAEPRYLWTPPSSSPAYTEFDLLYAQVGTKFDLPSHMTLLGINVWEAAAGVTMMAGLTVGAVLYLRRKQPTEEELERARRRMLALNGRLIDGMLLDVREITLDDGRPLTLLEYSYRSGGVDYECSQDITGLLDVVDPGEMRAGFPCTVRYQPGNPQNSIVIAETWSGLRSSLPVYPHIDIAKRSDLGELHPDRG